MVKGLPKAFPAHLQAGAAAAPARVSRKGLVKAKPVGEGPHHRSGSAFALKAPGHRGCGSSPALHRRAGAWPAADARAADGSSESPRGAHAAGGAAPWREGANLP